MLQSTRICTISVAAHSCNNCSFLGEGIFSPYCEFSGKLLLLWHFPPSCVEMCSILIYYTRCKFDIWFWLNTGCLLLFFVPKSYKTTYVISYATSSIYSFTFLCSETSKSILSNICISRSYLCKLQAFRFDVKMNLK